MKRIVLFLICIFSLSLGYAQTNKFKKYDFTIPFYEYCKSMISENESFGDSIVNNYTFINISTGDTLDTDMRRWRLRSGAIWYEDGGVPNDLSGFDLETLKKDYPDEYKEIQWFHNTKRLDLTESATNNNLIPTIIIDSLNNLFKGKIYIYDLIDNGIIDKTNTKYKLTCTGVKLSNEYNYPEKSKKYKICAMFDDIAVPIGFLYKGEFDLFESFIDYQSKVSRMIPVSKFNRELRTEVLSGELETLKLNTGSAAIKLRHGKIEVGMTYSQVKYIMKGNPYIYQNEDGSETVVFSNGAGRIVVAKLDQSKVITEIFRDAVYCTLR